MRYEFGSAGEVCCIEVSSVPQNLWVSILLKTSNLVGAKVDVPKIDPHDLTQDYIADFRDYEVSMSTGQSFYCTVVRSYNRNKSM